MRDQVDAPAEKAAHLGGAKTRLGAQGAQAQGEDGGRLGLAGEQALGGRAHVGEIGDGVLAHAAAGADIHDQPALLLDALDDEGDALAGGDGLADGELHAFQHRRAARVDAALAGGGKLDRDARAIQLGDQAEAELGFAFAEAALSDGIKGGRHGRVRFACGRRGQRVCASAKNWRTRARGAGTKKRRLREETAAGACVVRMGARVRRR